MFQKVFERHLIYFIRDAHARDERAESQKRVETEGNNMALLFGACVNSLRHGLFAGQDSTRVLSVSPSPFFYFLCFLQPRAPTLLSVVYTILRKGGKTLSSTVGRPPLTLVNNAPGDVLPLLFFFFSSSLSFLMAFWKERKKKKKPLGRIWTYYF